MKIWKLVVLMLGVVTTVAAAQGGTIGGGGGGTSPKVVRDTINAATFDSVRAVRMRADTLSASAGTSKPLTFQTWNAGGTRYNALILGSDSTATFRGVGTFNGKQIIVNQNSGVDTTTGVRVGNTGTVGFTRWNADTIALTTSNQPAIRIMGGNSSPKIIGGTAGGLTILCGTGNSRTCTFQSTTSAGTAKNTLVLGADSSATFLGAVSGKALTGTTLALSSTITGVTNITGNASSMTITAGTGNNRNMVLSTTTSVGLAKNTLTLGTDSSATFLGKIIAGDTLRSARPVVLSGLTTEGSTQSAVCVTNGGGEVFINAAATCTVSSRRYKDNIAPLPPMWDALARLRPVSFTYKVGGRHAIGLIAEEVADIDPRLVTYDTQGKPNSVNYEEMSVVLLSVVQEQQKQLDDIQKALFGLGSAGVVAGAVAARRRKKVA